MKSLVVLDTYATYDNTPLKLVYPLTLPMLRLLSSKAQECKILEIPLKPCRLGIHLKALAKYSQMSTHLPGFQ